MKRKRHWARDLNIHDEELQRNCYKITSYEFVIHSRADYLNKRLLFSDTDGDKYITGSDCKYVSWMPVAYPLGFRKR